MIKKRIIFLLSSLFVLIPCFSNAELIGDINWSNGGNGVIGIDLVKNTAGDLLDNTWAKTNNDFIITSLGNGNWTFYYDDIYYNNIYQLRTNNRGGVSNFFFWNNGKLIYHEYFNGPMTRIHTLEVQNFALVSRDDFGNFSHYTFNKSLDDVLNSNNNLSHQVFGVVRGRDGAVPNNALNMGSSILYCLGDGNYYYCASCKPGDNYTDASCVGGGQEIDLGLTAGSNISDIFNQGLNDFSPILYTVPDNTPIVEVPTVDGYDYIEITTGDTVVYFEDEFKLKKEMCFIGTRDLVSVYEDAIPYYQGTGYTIFDMYSRLFNVDSMSLKEVGIFVNSWFRNYETWFQGLNRSSSGSPLFNFTYLGPGNHGIDRGLNLSNPFLNNLSAYYFLGSTRADYSSYSDIDGEQLVYYCYKKLSYTSASNDGQNLNINDDHNKVYDEWVAVYVRNGRNYNGQFSGADSINSQSFHGTALDYFTGGDEDFTDFNSFFSKSFNKFASVFSNEITYADLGLGVLPNYLILFMLALIFFRFISH